MSCRQGDHTEERLVGRSVSNARAALRLLRSGYYDEALGLVRQTGEAANLLCLFVQSAASHERWKDATEGVLRNEFRPVDVRRKLTTLPLPLPMDKGIYGLLSTRVVHVDPTTSPQSHNPFNRPTLGWLFPRYWCSARSQPSWRYGWLDALAFSASPKTCYGQKSRC